MRLRDGRDANRNRRSTAVQQAFARGWASVERLSFTSHARSCFLEKNFIDSVGTCRSLTRLDGWFDGIDAVNFNRVLMHAPMQTSCLREFLDHRADRAHVFNVDLRVDIE